jgi:hypothetical protein
MTMARNPFRSEAAAFRFLLLTLVAFAAVAVAGIAGGAWVGLAVWALVSASAVALYVRRGRPRRGLASAPAHVGPPDERRVLLLAAEPVPDGELEQLRARADRVLVVSPASTSTLGWLTSDVDGARAEARARASATVASLRSLHVDADGAVTDDDAVRALEDALRTFGGDEIVVAASGASADALAGRIRERFALPVTRLAG